MTTNMTPGARVIVPTVDGPRDVPTHATYLGPDADNEGYARVRLDVPVMGELFHSIEWEDVQPA